MATSPRSPQPRSQAKSDNSETTRNSNYLRASVLDAALQLGFGSSRTVEDWMFNSVPEAEEESENVASPGVTSASPATSDESFLSPGLSTPATPYSANGKSPHIVTGQPDAEYAAEWREHVGASPLPSMVSSPSASPVKLPSKLHKLRKPRRGDGYESDAGYISEGAGKRDKGREKEEEKARKKEKKEREKLEKKEKKGKKGKDGAATETEHEHESDGGYLSELRKKKPKKNVKGEDDARKSREDTNGGDTSDGGYLSEASTKKKRSFFRLGTRSRKTSTTGPTGASPQPPFIPPVPAIPSLTLPIAERFARDSAPSSLDIDDCSRSVTPVPSTTRTSSTADGRPSMESSGKLPTASSIAYAPSIASADTSFSNVQTPPSPVSAPAQTIPRVRFTPSTAFDVPPTPMAPASPTPSPAPARVASPATLATSADPPQRPSISLPITSPAASSPSLSTPSSSSVRSPSPQPLLTRMMRPSPLSISPSPSPAPSSAESEAFTIVPSSDFVVPSPSFTRRSALLNPPRGHLGKYDLPPPSPPPQGPLPSVPGDDINNNNELNFPLPPSRAPSMPGLFSQPIPPIQRGRQMPFPVRPVLPAAESSDLVRRTNVVWRQHVPDITVDGPDTRISTDTAETAETDASAEEGDEAEMRPDIARFYFSNSSSAPGTPTTVSGAFPPGTPTTAGGAFPPETEVADDDDDRSMYPPTLATRRRGSYVDSYYFDSEDGQRRMSSWSRRASFLDDERSREVRRQFVARVGAMYGGGEEEVPPVPKLVRKF